MRRASPNLKAGRTHFVPQLNVFEGKRVLIVGGGDSAVDWALALAHRAGSR